MGPAVGGEADRLSDLRTELLSVIESQFSPDQFRELCLRLRVQLAGLPGESVSEKALNLVKGCKDEAALARIVQTIRRTWPEVGIVDSLKSLSPEGGPGRERDVPPRR
jgi:hypothetical protein